jgi:hypothetical protein
MRPQPDNGRTQHETNDESYAKTNGENYAETNEWLTVANAARFLGVTKQAIRQRIYRDTIPHRKASDGTVHVRITEDNPEANGESYGETHAENLGNTEAVNRELVDELRDRVGFLERQLEGEQRAHAELRRIIAGLVQRVPELEPAREATAETPDSPETASAPPEEHKAPPEQERRSWWRKVFGA